MLRCAYEERYEKEEAMNNKRQKKCPVSGFLKVSVCSLVNNGVCSKTGERCNMLATPEKTNTPKKENDNA